MDEPAADNRKQREKLTEVIGEGPTRRIRLIVLSILALSGVALQGLVWWYAVKVVSEDSGSAGIEV